MIGTFLKNQTGTGEHIKIVYLVTSCRRSGPIQQTLNIIKNLDQDMFEPVLITIYDETPDSRMADYLPYVSAHYLVKTSKMDILLGRYPALRKCLERIKPDIIHTVGLFPNYAVSGLGAYRQLHTLRNYVYDDYPAKFGRMMGTLVAEIHLSAIKRTTKVVCCSESLSRKYREKPGMTFDFIQNGVDTGQYRRGTDEEKQALRRKLGLPERAFIFVYTGQFIQRKNVPFLLESYIEGFGADNRFFLLLLGGGPELEGLRKKYSGCGQVDFRGNVPNVAEYLRACDACVSCSKSEGLPNGVLEAMATGLPAVLSDIEQHREILEAGEGAGCLYRQGDRANFISRMRKLAEGDYKNMGEAAYRSAHEVFSAGVMSKKYQNTYVEMLTGGG